MDKKNLESLLVSALTSATRGAIKARPAQRHRSPLSEADLSQVSGGAPNSDFSFEGGRRFQVASGSSSPGDRFFEGFDFATEGPGFVEFNDPEFVEASPPQFIEFNDPEFVEASPPQFIEFNDPEFVEASPPQFIEFNDPEFVEATPPRDGGFGGFGGFGGGLR